jgi:hypothetical protein
MNGKSKREGRKSKVSNACLAACSLAAVTFPFPAEAAQQESMGRLFFTPAQRSSLDIARSQRARTTLGTESSEQQPVQQEQTISYGGMVRRSDGKSTVWINGRPVTEQETASGATAVGRVGADGSVSLQVPQTGRRVELKPGQSVELLSGAIEEGYTRKPIAPEAKPIQKPSVEVGTAKSDSGKTARDLQEREQEQIKEALTQALEELAAGRLKVPPLEPPGAPAKPPPGR